MTKDTKTVLSYLIGLLVSMMSSVASFYLAIYKIRLSSASPGTTDFSALAPYMLLGLAMVTFVIFVYLLLKFIRLRKDTTISN